MSQPVNIATPIIQMIGLIPAEDLASAWGYTSANNSFRDFCARMGIKPIRPGWYDPHHVRARLDAAQGLGMVKAADPAQPSLVEQRRIRNGAV